MRDRKCTDKRSFVCQKRNITIDCPIEENTMYPGNSINMPNSVGWGVQNDAESCRSFCGSNYLNATHFTWIAPTPSSPSKCWCKSAKSGSQFSQGRYAGEICMGTSATSTTADACPIEVDMAYPDATNVNNGHNDPRQIDAESCRSFCESNYPTAKFFVWASLPSYNGQCFCKASDAGKDIRLGMHSGEICRGASTPSAGGPGG